MKTFLLALAVLAAILSGFLLFTGVDGAMGISEFELVAGGFSALVAAVLFVGYVLCCVIEKSSDDLALRTLAIQEQMETMRPAERRRGTVATRQKRTDILFREPERRQKIFEDDEEEEKVFNGPQLAIYVVIGLMVALVIAYVATWSDFGIAKAMG